MPFEQEVAQAKQWLLERSPEADRENAAFFSTFRHLRRAAYGYLSDAPMPDGQKNLLRQAKERMEEPFSALLRRMMDNRALTAEQLCLRAAIDVARLEALLQDAPPSKDDVLALALGMALDWKLTRKLLALTGFSLAGEKADLLAEYCIQTENYDIQLFQRLLAAPELDRIKE